MLEGLHGNFGNKKANIILFAFWLLIPELCYLNIINLDFIKHAIKYRYRYHG